MRDFITMDDVRRQMAKILATPPQAARLIVSESQLARAKARGEYIPPDIIVVPDRLAT